VFQNPDYMKENFVIKIESMHIADRGETENVSCPMFLTNSDILVMLTIFAFYASTTY